MITPEVTETDQIVAKWMGHTPKPYSSSSTYISSVKSFLVRKELKYIIAYEPTQKMHLAMVQAGEKQFKAKSPDREEAALTAAVREYVNSLSPSG